MDTQKLIEQKIKVAEKFANTDSLKAVLKHIDVAENYIILANQSDDYTEDIYTDVIYRTNHAYEGILKEAYQVINPNPRANATPYNIEEFFTQEDIFNTRVVELFTRYRQDWRNPSTHDHQLFFTSQEAILATLSVSSFIIVLMDQIIEQLSHNEESRRQNEAKENLKTSTQNIPQLIQKCEHILKKSAQISPELINAIDAEAIGIIHSLLESTIPDSSILTEANTQGRTRYHRPDLIIQKGDETVVIELKNSHSRMPKRLLIGQLERYIDALGIDQGIGYVIPDSQETEHTTHTRTYTTNEDPEKTKTIMTLTYKKRP